MALACENHRRGVHVVLLRLIGGVTVVRHARRASILVEPIQRLVEHAHLLAAGPHDLGGDEGQLRAVKIAPDRLDEAN